MLHVLNSASQLKNIQESIEFVNSKPKPLALYAFTNDEPLRKRIVSETSSGSVTFNDVLVHVCILLTDHKEASSSLSMG